MSFQSTTSSGASAGEGGPLTAIAGTALLFNLAGLWWFTGVALVVFGYIALTFFLSATASKSTRNQDAFESGNVVLMLSWVVALVGGALVGGLHWVQYEHAAYAVLGTFAVATLIWLVGRAFDGILAWLLPVAGVAMTTAVMQLGSPPGSDDMEKKENWTPIEVTVRDEAGEPIENAEVTLDLVHFWQSDPAHDADRSIWHEAKTDRDGKAEMALHDDPRFKRLVIRVRREAISGAFNLPSTIGDVTGYVDARKETILPAPKVPYGFELTMKQNAHPNLALLAVELKSTSDSPSSYRSLKVAITAASDSGSVDESQLDRGQQQDVYLAGSQKLVFKLGPDLAGRPLTLCVLERDVSRSDEAYRVLMQIPVDSIPLGSDGTIPTITVTDRESARSPHGIAETDRESFR